MEEQLKQAIDTLKKGGVIVYPTETAYGLGCDGCNEIAVNRIFEIKRRTLWKSAPVIVADFEMAREYCDLGALGEELAARFWPGPLTLIVKCKKEMPKGIISVDGSIAIRISSNEIARKLSLAIHRPIVATSANLSDSENKYSAQEVKKELVDAVDYYFDIGEIPHVPTSTIVDVRGNKPEIVREGGIRLE